MTALLAALLLQCAGAYELSGHSWIYQEDPVEDSFFLNSTSFPGAYLRSEVEDGYVEALSVWNTQAHAGFELRYGGSTTVTQYGGGADGTNAAMWTPSTPDGAVALSARTFLDADIVDCDIQFFGSNAEGAVIWSFDPDAAAGPESYHFIFTAVHELGHCLGLSHSEVSTAVMRQTQSMELGPADWELTQDDLDGIQAIYGLIEPLLVISDLSADIPGEEETRGASVELVVGVENQGTGTSFDVMGQLTVVEGGTHLVLLSTSASMGDVEAGASSGSAEDALVFAMQIPADCNNPGQTTLELVVTDEGGQTLTEQITFDIVCPVPPLEPVDDLDGSWTWNCSTAPAGSWTGALLLGGLVLIRRRRPGHGALTLR